MNIETVNELITSLESAGELSIKERKYLELAKAYVQLAAESVGLKSAITDHSQSVHFCEVCGKDDPCSTDDVCYALRETPATDRIVSGIKADAVKGIYSFNKVDCCVYLDGDVCMLIDAYEASLREGAK